MKKYLFELNKIINFFEANRQYKLANKCNAVFMRLANQDEDNLSDENLEDDEEFDDDDYDPSAYDAMYTHPTRIFFNSQTNQPIIHEGKMLATFSSEDDYPELRGIVKAMTGVENITIVRIPADVRKIMNIQTEADERRMDKIHQGHVDNIEYYPDIIYLLLVGENTLNVDGNDIIFASREDAESFANVLRIYFESTNQDVDIAPAALSVSLADSPEEGMSLPELLGDDEFIFFENSELGVWDRPETIGDLESLMSYGNIAKKMTVERLQELHSGKEEWELDNIFGDGDDEDGGEKFSSIMNNLHKIACEFENKNLYKQASVVNDIFEKLAAKKKKKKSSGKNVPTNPSLWSECKAWAKRTFDVYPSAYANGAAAKRYKSKGGGWKKASSESNLRLAQGVTVTPTIIQNLPGGAPEKLDITVENNPNATYPQVINSIKNLIVSGQKEEAHKTYSWHYNNNTALSAAQKQALAEQYTAILDRFKGTSDIANELAVDYDKSANTIVAQYINKSKIDKSQITKDSPSYVHLRKMISKIKDLSLRYTAIEILDSIANMNAKSKLVK